MAPVFTVILPLLLGTLKTYAQTTTTNSTTTSSCTTPTGFANTVVLAPSAIASSFQIVPAFADAHTVFLYTDTNAFLPEATIASFCLDLCIAYQPNTTTGPCLSFNVNLGKPIPPIGNGGSTRWFCSGFDAYLAEDGGDYVGVDAPGSYMHGVGVNRVCNGTYRAY